MKIDVTMQQAFSGNKLFSQIARRVRLVLNRFSTSISSVKVCITDTNGPKGGVDIRCVVSVKLASGGEVVVRGKGENVLSVLNTCLPRAARAVNRSLQRRRDTPIRKNRRNTIVKNEPLKAEVEPYEYPLYSEN